jgi:lipid II:glycine glycyltransferase (peptidoglycan interpeptide bridge formation enzyme)
MELKIADETDQQNWDAIVERSSNATLFHTWKWLKLMEKYSMRQNTGVSSQVKFYPLFLMEKDHPVGIYPLFFFKKMILSSTYSPPPNMETLYLGPIFPDIETMKEEKKQVLLIDVQREIDRFTKKELKSTYIQVNTPPGFEDCRSFKWGDYTVIPRYTYEIDLKKGKEIIWNEFSSRLKQDIKQVKKKGYHVEIGTRKDCEFVYDLLKQRNRINAKKDYILEIFDTFSPQNLKIFILKSENKNISGIVFISYKKKGWLWIGNPRFPYNGPSPNTLMFWEAINYAIDNGFEKIEIMGADDFSSFPFKRKFNGKIIPYYQMQWFSPSIKVFSLIYHSLIKKNNNQLDV